MDGTATMGGQRWGTRTRPWCSMATLKRPTPSADDSHRLLESEDLVARYPSRRQSATFTGLPQRICVPFQPAFLSHDRIQLYLGNCGTYLGDYLRDTLQRRVGSPDSMIGNKPDRQGFVITDCALIRVMYIRPTRSRKPYASGNPFCRNYSQLARR